MVASHPHLLQHSTTNESEIRKLVENHFLLNRAMLEWQPAAGEAIPTLNTNKIVVFSSFFQQGFGLLACNLLCELL
jgi:hypothetical protein